jgi:hypothetical protein
MATTIKALYVATTGDTTAHQRTIDAALRRLPPDRIAKIRMRASGASYHANRDTGGRRRLPRGHEHLDLFGRGEPTATLALAALPGIGVSLLQAGGGPTV